MKAVLTAALLVTAALLSLHLGSVSSAAPTHDALRVGAQGLSRPALDVLLRAARVNTPQAGLREVAAAATEDYVLGEYAARRYGDSVLFATQRVAHPVLVQADASLVATLQTAFATQLRTEFSAPGTPRPVTRRNALAPDELVRLLGSTALRLDTSLDRATERRMHERVLLDYRLGDGMPRHVSLLDVWRQLDVQGRSALRAGDAGLAMAQALSQVQAQAVQDWAVRKGGLDKRDLSQLHALMLDRERRVSLLRLLGADTDAHANPAAMGTLRAGVSAQDVATYYAHHRNEFERTERVRARQIRCPDEACINTARDALAAGAPFATVARRASNAASGEWQWLDSAQARTDWATQLAFAQPPGPASPPIREPLDTHQRGGWRIVQVAERVTGHHPADSETVRFAATEALVRERARTQRVTLRRGLLKKAAVAVDAHQLGFDTDDLREVLAR